MVFWTLVVIGVIGNVGMIANSNGKISKVAPGMFGLGMTVSAVFLYLTNGVK